MTRTAQGLQSSSVQATIEQLRYWAPSIKDVARVEEYDGDGDWTLAIMPHVAAACPVAITLKDNGNFDLALADETYLDRSLKPLDRILTLLEKIVAGEIVQRRWVSAVTGAHRSVETLVMLTPDLVWCDGTVSDGDSEHHDRHFLPYRRI